MGDNDLGKAVSETIKLYHFGGEGTEGGGRPIANIDKRSIDDRLIVFHRPRSIESEYFRFLKSRIEQEFGRTQSDNKGRVVMITGPNLAAGKSTLSINMALAFARSYGNKTLFMDVDSRKGTSGKYLGIVESKLKGFTDVLNMKVGASEVLVNSGLFDMVYFPSGEFNEAFLDNLNGEELGILMDSLRERFRYIIIDAPPAFPMPEPAIIAQKCDGVFIVLKAGRDGYADLKQSLEALEGANIMGVILNAVKRTPGQKYGAYGYYGKGT